MKKRLFLMLVMVMVLFSNSVTAYAAFSDDNFVNRREIEKQQSIDMVMEALNDIALEKKYDKVVEKGGKSGKNVEKREDKYEVKKREYEKNLEELGVHKIDPTNPKDMAMLEEMQQDLTPESTSTFSARSSVYDSAPDFNMIANVYSLYIYNGTYKQDGVSYNYRYIRVVDDKGYNGLYYYQDNDLAVNIPASIVESVFSYNFGYGVSTLIGTLPYGTVIDWTLGNIFNVASTVDAAKTISCGNKPLYGVRHIGVTEMTYYFFYNDGWKHIGTSGNAEVIREDYFYGNVKGKPVSETQKSSFSIRSGWIWHDFVERYVEVMDSRPNYCYIQDFGGLMIKGFNGAEYYYAPVFAGQPIELI